MTVRIASILAVIVVSWFAVYFAIKADREGLMTTRDKAYWCLLSALLGAVLTTGCTSPTLRSWSLCPTGMELAVNMQRGQVNGSDLLKVYSGGEADGVDSNFESVGGEVRLVTQFRDYRRCPQLGGHDAK